jgi:hypothetical protein
VDRFLPDDLLPLSKRQASLELLGGSIVIECRTAGFAHVLERDGRAPTS